MVRCLVLIVLLLAAAVPGVVQAQDTSRYGYAFRNEGGDDAEGIARLDQMIRDRLRAAGLVAESGDSGKIEVVLTHYYMRSSGARFWAGAMAGRDKIASTVRVLDASGAVSREFEVDHKNVTAFGSSDGLMEKHADAILAGLRE